MSSKKIFSLPSQTPEPLLGEGLNKLFQVAPRERTTYKMNLAVLGFMKREIRRASLGKKIPRRHGLDTSGKLFSPLAPEERVLVQVFSVCSYYT